MKKQIKTLFGYVAAFLSGVARFFVSQWNQYNTLGQFLFVLALGAIANDAAISYKYGEGMSAFHATGFALVALAFCILPDVAIVEWRKGRRATGAFIGGACLLILLPVAWQSHIGYGGGIRLGDMQQTGFQHASLANLEHSLQTERDKFDLWKRQREELSADRARALAAQGWSPTLTADGLRSEVAALDVKIASEKAGKRGGRGKGCGDVCEQLMDQKTKLMGQISGLEKLDVMAARIAELDKQIEATGRLIDEKTAAIAATGYRSSNVVNQNDVMAKLWNLAAVAMGREIKPEDAIKPAAWQQHIASLVSAGTSSIAFMLVGPLLWAAAGFNRVAGALGIVGGGNGTASQAPAARPETDTDLEPAVTVTPLRPASSAAAVAGLEAVHARRARATDRLLQMRQSRVDASLLAATA